jgi:hypothetical protein
MKTTPKLILAIAQNAHGGIVDVDGTKIEIVPILVGTDGIGRPAHPVYNEVKEAYCDINRNRPEDWRDRRNLSFRASEAVDRDTAIDIFRYAIRGYNEFEPQLLTHLPKKAKITIAREYSVCIYVDGKVSKKIASKLKCNECDYNGKETRIWWD